LSAASLALRVPAIRQFHKHLCAEGHRRDDPALPVEGPRRGQPLPRVLTVGDVDRLIGPHARGLDAPERPLRERAAAARAT
jgi:integrase/recombinase XerD